MKLQAELASARRELPWRQIEVSEDVAGRRLYTPVTSYGYLHTQRRHTTAHIGLYISRQRQQGSQAFRIIHTGEERLGGVPLHVSPRVGREDMQVVLLLGR
eukprot:GHVL01025206.1.p2 GENE.GHVL01025206.1~~GHVL01025206.1.p2  ORF type:complete len:101 (-),score=7.18 GHVL01025206.1:327-629(-)